MSNSNKETSKLIDFITWRSELINDSRAQSEASSIIQDLQNHYAELANILKYPNLLPYHLESLFLGDHLKQVFSIIIGLSSDRSILQIKELRDQHHLENDLIVIEHIITEHNASYMALATFITILLSKKMQLLAEPESRAERVGLMSTKYSRDIQPSDLDNYAKLIRLFEVENDLVELQKPLNFFHYSGLHITADSAYELNNINKVQSEIVGIFDYFKISPRQQELILFTVKQLLYWRQMLSNTSDRFFSTFLQRAEKAGFDPADALDFYISAITLEKVLSTLTYVDHQVHTYINDLPIIIDHAHYYHHHLIQSRIDARQQIENKIIKEIMAEYDFDPAKIMDDLNIPHGPQRGDFMIQLYKLLKNSNLKGEDLFGNKFAQYKDQVNNIRESLNNSFISK